MLDVSGWDPFYLDIFGAVPRVLRAVCGRICAAFTDDAVADLGRLVARLERGALHGHVTLPNGHRQRTSLTRQELFFTLVSGDLDELLRASFPGAVKSALRGDLDPILRLKRHAALSEGSGSPRDFSSGLYAATACEEIPFPWTRFSDPATASARSRRGGADPGAGALPVRPRHRRGQRLHPHVPPLARGVARARPPGRRPARCRTCRC